MALQKTEALSLGTGSLVDNSGALVMFSSANSVAAWSISVTYLVNQTVEYSSSIWKCVTPNIGSPPSDLNPAWQIIYKNCKDGDLCFVFDGLSPNILQRIGGFWIKYRDTALQISLNDGQLASAVIFTYIGSDNYFSKLEYTIRRGSGHVRKRAGSMNILNNGTNGISYDHEFMEIGTDVNTWITPVISGGIVQLQYTSSSEGDPITMQYILKGWT